MIEVSVEELFEAANDNVVHFDPTVNTEISSLLGKLKEVKTEHLTKIEQQRKDMAALTKVLDIYVLTLFDITNKTLDIFQDLIGGALEASNDAAVVVGNDTKGNRKKVSRTVLDLSVILPEGKRTPKPQNLPIKDPTPIKRHTKAASKTGDEKKSAKADEKKLAKALQKIASQVAPNITWINCCNLTLSTPRQWH